jgi:hypothetical protein
LKGIGLIVLATYLAFCATLYFAGDGKDFSDPFVQVAGNVTPTNATSANGTSPRPSPVATPKASQATRGAGAKRRTDKPASPASKTDAVVKPK